MNLIILAAGRSSRIFKEIGKHKCLLTINNKTLLSKIIDDSLSVGIKKILVVVGFKSNKLKQFIRTNHKKIKIINNKDYSKTDMLHSAFLALKNLNDDIIISYSDIIYDKEILQKIKKQKSKNILIPLKSNWKSVWEIRKKNIKKDAENLKFNNKNYLQSIGGKILKKYPKGQYMGLLYIPKNKIKKIIEIYKKEKIKKMQISHFLNFLINKGFKIKIIKSKNYWYEFDDIDDYNNFKSK
jgi:choline kinase